MYTVVRCHAKRLALSSLGEDAQEMLDRPSGCARQHPIYQTGYAMMNPVKDDVQTTTGFVVVHPYTAPMQANIMCVNDRHVAEPH